MSILNLFQAKYRNPTELAICQDSILDTLSTGNPVVDRISLEEELKKFSGLMVTVGKMNPVALNNLAIRYYMILALFRFLDEDSTGATKFKSKADSLFRNLCDSFLYSEGYSYFLYVKRAYEVFWQYVPKYGFGSISPSYIKTCENAFHDISAPDGRILFGDYRGEVLVGNSSKVKLSNPSYPIKKGFDFWYMVNLDKDFKNNCWNGHVNYEYGAFYLWSKGDWFFSFPYYTGWGEKVEKLKKGTLHFNNITFMEDVKVISDWVTEDTVVEQTIGLRLKDSTRVITLDKSGKFLTILDKGGVSSIFNLGPGYDKNRIEFLSGTTFEMNGLLEITGQERKIKIHL